MPYLKRMQNILKKTKSICPKCMKVIDASVFEKKDGVWMHKECDEHGKFKGLVEKDVEFYKKVMNEYPVKRNENIENLMITFTHKCNLNCNFCFLSQRNRKDFSTEDLKKIISESSCKSVRISGGEPTLRDDLFDIIRFIKKNKKVSALLTNGIKLADLNYVKKLKDAGLDWVGISFNGFNDEVYKKLNGRKLLKIKLKALENLKKVGITTSLAFIIAKGINDKELRKVFDYCIENNSFIKELRLRSFVPISKPIELIESNQVFVSDMITEFSEILNIDREEFMNTIDKKNHMVCSYAVIILSYKKNGHIYPWTLVKMQSVINPNYSSIADESHINFKNKIFIILKNLSKININTLFKLMMREIRGKNKLALKLSFKSWPSIYNMDLDSMFNRCPSYQLSRDGRMIPLCYAGKLNNKNIIEI